MQTLASFHRPLILTDDLLHNGYRLRRLQEVFRREQVEIREVIVGILSDTGLDLMAQQGCRVEAVYHIPNLLHWFNESLLYPFIGGSCPTTILRIWATWGRSRSPPCPSVP